MAAIFLSHASRDDALACEVESWLKKQGFDDIFVDHDSIRSGDKWSEALRRAGGSCRVILSLVTPDWLASSECFGEFTAGWYAGRRMIPLICIDGVVLDDTQKSRLSRVLLEDQGVDISRAGAPLTLNLDVHPELSKPLIEGLRAAGALAKVGLDPSVFSVDNRRDSEGSLLKSPYPGLESFGDTDADAAIFYGRSSEIAEVLDELREFRATGDRRAYAQAGRAYVIQGASGSGKSSLLNAGVLPRLRRERGWVALRSFRPGAEPLLHFAEVLARPIEGWNFLQSPGIIRDRLFDHWRAAKSEAAKAGAAIRKGLPAETQMVALNKIDLEMLQHLRPQLDAEITSVKLKLDRPAATALIAIDQGEELVRAESDGADALADYLRAALLQVGEGEFASYGIVLTIRTDSFHEMQICPRLQGIGTRLFDLRPLPVYRFAEAIEKPASRYGVEIEPQLVEALIDDAGGMDALPLLAFTLQRLWRQYEVEKRIRKANYESMGKLLGLIEDAAERALRGFDPSVQQGPFTDNVPKSRDVSAQHVFLPALAQVNERGEPIRRIAAISSFNDEGREILGWFEKWRLVITSEASIEVAHDALFRVWPRFRRWMEPARERLVTLRGLESAAEVWNSNERGFDYISHAGRRLRNVRALMKAADFRKHIDTNSTVRDYLRAATRVEIGWQIAHWYSLTIICYFAIWMVGGWFSTHLIGDDFQLSFGMIGVYNFNSGLLAICLAYLAALLRQLTLRSGFQTDMGVLCLILIVGVAASFPLYWNLPPLGQLARDLLHQRGIENPDDLSVRIVTINYTADAVFNFITKVSLFCVVLQFLLLISIPFRSVMRKFAKSQRYPAK